jgi:hypothetical protein
MFVPERDRAALAEGDEIDFLGSPPMLVGLAALYFEHFWRCRMATPPDDPVDPDAALRLFERLYGEADDVLDFWTALAAMDSEYATRRAAYVAQQSETKGG